MHDVNDECPFYEISLKRYEECLNEIYQVEEKGKEITDLEDYTQCVCDFFSAIQAEFWKKGQKDVSDGDAFSEMEKRIMGKALDEMVKLGAIQTLIDEHGEVFYQITELGKEMYDPLLQEIIKKDEIDK